MRKIKFLTTIAVVCSLYSCANRYHMVWSDEFNKDGPPDSLNWKYENGFVRNHEEQWYQPDNAYCRNGLLVIEGRKVSKPNPLYVAGDSSWRKSKKTINYTSASINTNGSHAWRYGRFVIRARINIASGLWPAWWTLGVKGQWPANGEIDIMEYYRNMLLANIACNGENNRPEWFSRHLSIDSLGGVRWASRFHIWRMDWDEKHIALYVDNNLINEVPLTELANKDGSGINPFMQPHFILLDLAMGGMNGGIIGPATPFPNKFEIDYVRVYQRQGK